LKGVEASSAYAQLLCCLALPIQHLPTRSWTKR